MVRKVMTVLLVGGCMALAACNTVRGAAADVGSAANCTENAIHGQNCGPDLRPRPNGKAPPGEIPTGLFLGRRSEP